MDVVRRWAAPGRVNLVGEHLDYNGGPVLPMAIDKYVIVKARQRADRQVHVWSQLGAKAEFDLGVSPGEVTGWADLVAGVVWAMCDEALSIGGADLVIESQLSAGAGLSSSAATAVATVSALADLAGIEVDKSAVARLARRAETDFMGTPVGVMDQLASAHGGVNLIDTATGRLTAVSPRWEGLSLVVIDTGIKHAIADGQYAERHRECADAAAHLAVENLAAAGPDAVLRFDESDPLKRRVRHAITETTRVRAAVHALANADNHQFGAIMSSSHESLRDDFEVSCSELDAAVEAAIKSGALGARMTGGGFGGSAIALVPTESLLGLREKVLATFERHGWSPPTLATVRSAPGVRRLL